MASTSKSSAKKSQKGKGGAANPAKWKSSMPGIPDMYFERVEDIPITKEEVRAILLSKARIHKGAYVLEIGCGSGSITVEAARLVTDDGIVTAIDKDEAAVELTKKNIDRFGIDGYVKVLYGDALTLLKEEEENFSTYSCVIIGGTGGDTAEIIKECSDMLNRGGRIVITTILIETLHAVLDVMDTLPFEDVDITQVTISKSRKTSTGTMMLARNPVTIISATLARDL